eukprot:CAMPEP_0194085246 /NCGR_PEP_ID=MMETSP0149-20130528/16828_1 /TAXON_ID=122233 /ORGANISM="Chaetoceros debilis, Strain MM31A-1" /LENGTH=818 /DNA_ID=CAMNT_0038768085 /DNA_START=108 /DNA_END=2564 /DNA_ORIENTATION=-
MRLSEMMREMRHSPCLMTPLSALIVFFLITLFLVSFALQMPIFFLGLIMAPLLSRSQWLVEFLYPLGIARWGHILILRWGSKGKNGVKLSESDKSMNMHSRAIEHRTEVVKGRVFIHPLPQFLDNVGYLIVCLPPKRSGSDPAPIIGILVDCGDAESVIDQVELIKDVHYANVSNNTIVIKALLCTHKHHDHTAGNKGLLEHAVIGSTLKDIYGGAIEKVPYCTKLVRNGDLIQIPHVGKNNMGDFIEIECIAVPSHTRGSMVYALRNKPADDLGNQDPVFSYLFTGDAMFSGGAGVPFEAELEFAKDKAVEGKTVHSRFKPGAGGLSVERCFAEILRRGIKDEDAMYFKEGMGSQQMIIFPGHEYTFELLQRQMQQSNLDLNGQWNRHQPSVFFELASQFFVAGHRRYLPKSTKLLTVPSTIKRELKVNPSFRSLRKRGEHIVTAISVWYKYIHDKGSKRKEFRGSKADKAYLSIPPTFSSDSLYQTASAISCGTNKSPSSENTWNVNHADFNRSMFTTVYTSDLDQIIESLKSGSMSSERAAIQVGKLSDKMETPAVARRPIPNTLPNERKMYLGLLAFATLGSPPSAMTVSDSSNMNLPQPVSSSDHLLISKKMLISSLYRLGLMIDDSSNAGADEIIRMINLLWKDARMERGGPISFKVDENKGDLEAEGDEHDLIQLGALKLTLFSVSYNQPTWFSKWCMPCKSSNPQGQYVSKMKRSGGDLVKHDTARCPMCSNALGCPKADRDTFVYDDDDSIDDDLSYGSHPSATDAPVEKIHVMKSPTKSEDGNIQDGNIELRAVRGVSEEKVIHEREK